MFRLGLVNTQERWHQLRSMGDEVDDLRAKVLEQGLGLEGQQWAAADSEERQKSNDAGLLEIIAQIGSGRKQPLSTAVGAGRDAATPSSEHSDVGDGSRKGERVPAETGHLGKEGKIGDITPQVSRPSTCRVVFQVQRFWVSPKWQPPC